MKIYLVGGAVRDELLGRPIKEKDWVVVGSTPEEMIRLGYQPVGKDFPVFLHPKTHEEYALARTERKTAKGYKGFQFYASPDVTLEADLVRRDLTINAMAKNMETGEITDPFDGQKDLQHKILRHVSPAFSEDPVRILRVARFAAQFPVFSVHAKTNQLMHHMVKVGEADALVAERVWKELSRALMAEKPARFFDVLVECEAFSVLFPELKKEWRTDAFDRVVANSLPATSRFAAILYGLSVEHIQSLCKRFRVPSEFSDMAILVSKYHERYEKLDIQNVESILLLLKSVDGFRRAERFSEWMQICTAIYPDIDHEKILLSSLAACKNIDVQSLVAKKLVGVEFAKAVEQLQIEAINRVIGDG